MARSLILTITIFWLAVPAAPAQGDGRKFQDDVKTTVADTINAGKDFLSGLAEGFEEAGKGRPEIDPSHIVAGKADLQRLLKVEIVRLEDQKDGRYQVTAALRNENEFPVRVTGLSGLGNVVLLDADGFSYPLPDRAGQAEAMTVLARSASRLKVVFTGVEARPAVFRLFDVDIAIPRWPSPF